LKSSGSPLFIFAKSFDDKEGNKPKLALVTLGNQELKIENE